MTERLYYNDAYTTSFEASVVERFRRDGQTALVLDLTYFYPTSGGQPADRGRINDVPVVDVLVREEDDAIIHVLDGEVWTEDVSATVNWERRFDHMQQHTGQHILSQAFLKAAGARTVGFHLSENSVTIDLHISDLKPDQIQEAEILANQIVWEDRRVRTRFVSHEEAEEMALRNLPELETESVRLIEIEQFDVTACGGTHLVRTGSVGIIKIVDLENRRNGLRVEFCCGKRALLDFRRKNRIVNKLAAEFTTGYWNLERAVENLRQEAKDAQRRARRHQNELLSLVAEKLLNGTVEKNGFKVVTKAFEDRGSDELRILAKHLIEHPNTIALLGLSGDKSQLIFARSEQAPGQMHELIKPALQVLGTTAGGGSPVYAQGGGPAAGADRVRQALSRAERRLTAQLH
jgi:alanyl-tRNA synthetase